MNDYLISASGLTKYFGSFAAVNEIDFAVEPGEAFGFLGANGAGKSTTMRMIGCVSDRDEGDLQVLGLDPHTHGAAIRSRIGVVPQEDNLDTELTVWDNLMIYGRYFNMPRAKIRERAAELLEFAQLEERRNDKVDPLSGGMKRRLTIARSLINRPELILLDEPTTGLDPQARHLLWERLYQLKREGATLVLTTHYLDEAEQLCDRLVIMDHAKVVARGSPRELIERYATKEVVEMWFRSSNERDQAANSLLGAGERIEALAERVIVYTNDTDHTLKRSEELAVTPTSTLVRRSTLEDVFLMITGRTLTE